MADLSKIKAPDGTEVDIKDATARSGLADKMDKANPTGTGTLSMNRKSSTTVGSYSTTLGYYGTASGNYSTALGNRTKATGAESVAEGYSSTSSGSDSHAEGYSTTASGASAHSEGSSTTASGNQSHAEGSSCTAEGKYSHAEGQNSSTNSTADAAHAEGYYTEAIGKYSHAEGSSSEAHGQSSHAEGNGCYALMDYSHAEGNSTNSEGIGSHTEGLDTISYVDYQHVSGKYNVPDSNTDNLYAEIIGNGTDANNRSNARTLDWSGNEWLAGGLSCGNFSASGSTITLGSPADWRNAIFNTTHDRLAFTLSRPNVYLYEYIGNKGSGDGIVKIALPENNSSMYDIYISETGWKHIGTVRAVAATNANGALDYCGYASISPTLTAAYGTVTATTNRNIQVTGTGNRQLYMSVGSYSVLNVKIITSSPEAPNVYFQ